jgi:hypothetical protein
LGSFFAVGVGEKINVFLSFALGSVKFPSIFSGAFCLTGVNSFSLTGVKIFEGGSEIVRVSCTITGS